MIGMWNSSLNNLSKRMVCKGKVLSVAGNSKYRIQDIVSIKPIYSTRNTSNSVGLWSAHSGVSITRIYLYTRRDYIVTSFKRH